MMLKKLRALCGAVSAAVLVSFAAASLPERVPTAEAASDPVIVVSLGDSYSSGEGVEEFYGQNKSVNEKVQDYDWLAHRSTNSWPGQIQIPGIKGTMKDYRVEDSDSSECKWYFRAASGAETKHFKDEKQNKPYKKLIEKKLFSKKYLEGSKDLPLQLDVFKELDGKADYVTLSVGGNDVGFKNIIETCAKESTYIHTGVVNLKVMIDDLWKNFDKTRRNIKQTYHDVADAAGPQAAIIVAGYPKLLSKKGWLINEEEANIVNENVTKFNNELKSIVNECRTEGLNIYFVDVEAEFDKDGGHQADTKNAWINTIYISANSQDLIDTDPSSYSVHPNLEGTKAYARCVNAAIASISKQADADGVVEYMGWWGVNDHYYEPMRVKNVTGAEAAEICRSHGGYLAHINDSEENEYLKKFCVEEYGLGYAFFGYSDEKKEGTWEWLDGSTSANGEFSNWSRGEPNNDNGGENFATLRSDGTWNDENFERDSFSKHGAVIICEYEEGIPVYRAIAARDRYRGHFYEVFDASVSWTEAEARCRMNGGHLASVNSSGEQKFLQELIKASDKENFWIGGYTANSTGNWEWTDGSEWSYENWDEDQPDCLKGAEFCLRMKNRDKDYPHWSAKDGKWNDSENSGDSQVTLDTFGYICEWDNDD